MGILVWWDWVKLARMVKAVEQTAIRGTRGISTSSQFPLGYSLPKACSGYTL